MKLRMTPGLMVLTIALGIVFLPEVYRFVPPSADAADVTRAVLFTIPMVLGARLIRLDWRHWPRISPFLTALPLALGLWAIRGPLDDAVPSWWITAVVCLLAFRLLVEVPVALVLVGGFLSPDPRLGEVAARVTEDGCPGVPVAAVTAGRQDGGAGGVGDRVPVDEVAAVHPQCVQGEVVEGAVGDEDHQLVRVRPSAQGLDQVVVGVPEVFQAHRDHLADPARVAERGEDETSECRLVEGESDHFRLGVVRGHLEQVMVKNSTMTARRCPSSNARAWA